MSSFISALYLTTLLISITPLAMAEYIKISHNGVELPGTAILGNQTDSWACTYDNERQLLWEIKTDDQGLRHQAWKYTWFDSKKTSEEQGHDSVSQGATLCFGNVRCDTEKYLQDVNTQKLCGTKDWRLPEVNELKSLVRCVDGVPLAAHANQCEGNYATPTIDLTYFPNTPDAPKNAEISWYYSATPYADDPKLAVWMTNFADGGSSITGRYNKGLVRAVSSGKPLANAVVYNDKTGQLLLLAVKVGEQYYSATLQDKGGYRFSLVKTTKLNHVRNLQFPDYDTTSNKLNIPYLQIGAKTYQVRLQFINNLFTVSQVTLY